MQMRYVPYLRRFVVYKKKTKKFYDFVRHRTNVVRQTSDVLQDDEFEFVTSLSSTQRRAWVMHDTENIRKAFSGFKTMPGRKTVIAHFGGDPVLSHILSREGADRCYEKVKSLFKRKAEN